MIDSKLISYTNDQLSYFSFNSANTQNLNLSNYYVVIKSTNSEEVYSLVTLPYFDYGDEGRTEHQLLTTENNGLDWDFAEKIIETDNLPYTYETNLLDASSFKLNVTRGYMPSDFIYDGNNTLRIQDMPINNLVIDIRQNGGGSSSVSEELMQYISPVEYKTFDSSLLKISNYLVKKHKNILKTIMLEVREKNTSARQFYNKLGFIEKSIRYNYYPDDNAILIEKEIK